MEEKSFYKKAFWTVMLVMVGVFAFIYTSTVSAVEARNSTQDERLDKLESLTASIDKTLARQEGNWDSVDKRLGNLERFFGIAGYGTGAKN